MATTSEAAPTAVTGPVLSRTPTADQISAYYPKAALKRHVAGRVKLICRVKIDGAGLCRAVREAPPGLGFADAAERLSTTFQFAPGKGPDGPVEGRWTTYINFALPAGGPPGTRWPRLAQSIRPEDIEHFYPPLALKLELEGDAVVTCAIEPTGAARSCQAQSESPPGLGFAPAAEQLAIGFRFVPAQVNGVPSAGFWTSRIAFRLAEDPPAAPSMEGIPDAPPSPEMLVLAQTFIDLSGRGAMTTALDGDTARAACLAAGGAYCDQLGKAVDAGGEKAKMEAALLVAVAQTYTEDELRAAINYLTSPEGSAIRDKAPEVARALERARQRIGREVDRIVRDRYCTEVRCTTGRAISMDSH